MSQENVELQHLVTDWPWNIKFVLASYDWGNRERKFARDWWHPDGEFINSREDPDYATYRGTQAIERLVASWMDAYPDAQIHALEARANGNRVFLWVRLSGQGTASGLPLETEAAHVVTLEDGVIRRIEVYLDRAEGLKAVGLEE